MAFTRKFLKALEIDEDKIEQIIDAHTEVTTALKEARDAYKADADKLADVQNELTKLKAEKEVDDPYKAKYEKEHEAFEAFKKEAQSKDLLAKKTDAYKALLKEASISDKYLDSILNVTVFDDFELDEAGKIKDADKAIEDIKSKYAGFVVTTGTQGAGTENPPSNMGKAKPTMADIYRRDEHGRYVLSTAERQKAIMEGVSDR